MSDGIGLAGLGLDESQRSLRSAGALTGWFVPV